MKIPFHEIGMIELEQFHKMLLESVENKDVESLVLDFSDVSKMGLCSVQVLISLKKYCDEFNIELKLENMGSSQLKNSIQTYKLDEILGIK